MRLLSAACPKFAPFAARFTDDKSSIFLQPRRSVRVSGRLLYMEDDAAQARLVQKCLERAGYAVDVAGDGSDGPGRHATQRPMTLVIVDQTMPGLSGLEVLRAMAARGQLPAHHHGHRAPATSRSPSRP